MDFDFASRKLGKQLSSDSEIQKAFGGLARAIKLRLAVLRAARTLAEVPRVPPERCHELKGNRSGCFAVNVSRNQRLIFRPDHDPVPRKADMGIDLQMVTAILIEGVEDYHGD
ncbi:MAG: system killer suppression protein [Nitratireductor sp.]